MLQPENQLVVNSTFNPGFLSPLQSQTTVQKFSDQELEDTIKFLSNPQNITPNQINLLNAAKFEQNKRQNSAVENRLFQILAPKDQNKLLEPIQTEETNRANVQRNMLNQIFGNQVAQGVQSINQQFAPIRANQISEEAVLGRLRSPESIPIISKIDQQKQQAINDLIRGLGTQQLQANTGLESDLANRLQRAREFATEQGFRERMSLADIIKGQQQFGLQKNIFDLDRERFEQGQRQFDIGQQNAEKERNLQLQLGQLQADASRPSLLGQIFGGLGSLGNLVGGIGAAKIAFK